MSAVRAGGARKEATDYTGFCCDSDVSDLELVARSRPIVRKPRDYKNIDLQAVYAAKKRDVVTRVVCYYGQMLQEGSQILSFGDAGIPVYFVQNLSASVHSRFAILDERISLNGSFNWSERARRGEENVGAMRVNGKQTPSFTDAFAGVIASKKLLERNDFRKADTDLWPACRVFTHA